LTLTFDLEKYICIFSIQILIFEVINFIFGAKIYLQNISVTFEFRGHEVNLKVTIAARRFVLFSDTV